MCVIMLFVTTVLGCATPQVQLSGSHVLLKSALLGFITDGLTTREEALVRLGMPASQFEGDKILLYQLRSDQNGNWHLVAPKIDHYTGFRHWQNGTGSLVLVFNTAGVLQKHSLVLAQ